MKLLFYYSVLLILFCFLSHNLAARNSRVPTGNMQSIILAAFNDFFLVSDIENALKPQTVSDAVNLLTALRTRDYPKALIQLLNLDLTLNEHNPIAGLLERSFKNNLQLLHPFYLFLFPQKKLTQEEQERVQNDINTLQTYAKNGKTAFNAIQKGLMNTLLSRLGVNNTTGST